jgi:hypothetical protein
MPNDQKEINRNKQIRRRAPLDMCARRMGHKSWSNFGSKLRARIILLEETGTEAEVNAAIMGILADSLFEIKAGRKIRDKELKKIVADNPRLRKNWRKSHDADIS